MRQAEKDNNRGLTLIELVVVIAVIGVLTGAMGISISLAFSRDAERCAKTIDQELERARMDAMSKSGDFTLVIDNRTTPPEIRITNTVMRGNPPTATDSTRTVGLQHGVTIAYYADGVLLTDAEFSVAFKKSNGAVESTSKSGSLFRIEVKNPYGRVAAVVLVKSTGKHYVEYQ